MKFNKFVLRITGIVNILLRLILVLLLAFRLFSLSLFQFGLVLRLQVLNLKVVVGDVFLSECFLYKFLEFRIRVLQFVYQLLLTFNLLVCLLDLSCGDELESSDSGSDGRSDEHPRIRLTDGVEHDLSGRYDGEQLAHSLKTLYRGIKCKSCGRLIRNLKQILHISEHSCKTASGVGRVLHVLKELVGSLLLFVLLV